MSSPVNFIDLAAQRARLKDRLDAAVAKVLEEGKYILGPEVTELETRLKAMSGAPHAIACANGTDALALPLMAWGLRPNDAVFVPSFTFASTAEVVPWLGATPVFVDIDPDTWCMDPEALKASIAKVKSEGKLNPRVVIAVDLFGQPADYRRIAPIARENGLKLIADSAQGFGCTLDGNHPIHWADIATLSFYPAKPLGCYGDGGAMLIRSDEDRAVIKSLHIHGEGSERYEYARIGMNSRLDTIQAAILLVKMDVFEDEIGWRNEAADRYAAGFGDIVKTPPVIGGAISAWAQYTIEVDDRDGFRKALADEGIPTAIYYPRPLHTQPPYQRFAAHSVSLANTERAAARVVSLPMDSDLGGERQDRVIAAVRKVLG
ncbi:DegT/DnrJ/EryC1/StrS aminotransferase family protein [Glycocaulis sp.]|uniref:DegT/DnrJ/EryC1/StrS family aminotransferase n=1 Tax=Glycocaulis sp. TaxID=1969725 RepID=UPI0025C08499|nr:DegT/DnrJ/EryC1/StrS aminotransferase family protein [Glycocaulis sp.]MCH8522750.1 DegT/DnrJ/EryC1/StrS aminotransferase family protein [Glycocaulis sp.]